MSLWTLLKSHLGPYRGILALVVALQAVQTSATLALPTLNADIIDKGVLVGDNDYIRKTGLIMVGFTLVQICFAMVAVWFGAKAAMNFGRDIRHDLFTRVLDFSTREVGQFGAPSLITRTTNDVQQVQQLVVLASTIMITAPLTFVIGVIMAIREDAGLSKILFFVLPLAAVILGSIVVRMVPAFQVMQIRIDRINTVLREQISGMRVVRAFVREPEEAARFAKANEELTNTSLKTGRLMAAMFPTVSLLVNMSSIAVLYFGSSRIDAGQMGLGSLVAYISYLMQILIAVVMVTFLTSMIPRAAVAAERILEVLETTPSIRASKNAVTELPEQATLEFRSVGFRYPGADTAVLEDISFRIEPGQTTAIIGSTGAGKTTLVNLIPRLFDATSGAVLVGGVDVKEIAPAALWSRMGYIPQKSYLFSGTIASNLRFGRPDASDEELWRALEIAQVAGFVQTLPDGLESEINQGGTNVSGGQRQRLAIARALVVEPEIYIFDDSFSALDLATDARLRADLAPVTTAAAVLVVAQRVSTIAGADEILVVEDGKIVGRGKHEELIQDCEIYAEIVSSQLKTGAQA